MDVIDYIKQIRHKYEDGRDNVPVDKKYVREDLNLIIAFIKKGNKE